MKKVSVLLLAIFTFTNVFGQTDRHGNPVFNNQLISEEKFENFELTSNYYTIKDNISNEQSSVYISKNPSLSDYLKFSRDLPSYFFIIHSGADVKAMIILLQKNEGSKTTLTYRVVNPNNGQSLEVPCNVFGEISEKRVEELENIKIDTAAKILKMPNGNLYLFNDVAYRIQPYDKLKEEVMEIAKQITSTETQQEIKDPIDYIKKETIGGKLDFNKVLENEKQGLFLYDGVAYNKKNFAIYLWAKKIKTLSIDISDNAVKLWEEIHGRILTEPEKKALVSGFESK